MAKKKYYAYAIESTNSNKSTGICTDWDKCKEIIAGQNAKYKSFPSKEEAEKWLEMGASYDIKNHELSDLEDGIYFDAGTGRGIGVEVRVTDKYGESLIHKVVPKEKITEHGNYLTEQGSTNNFGELLGCYIALKIAIKEKHRKIFGDSKLIIDFWSKGYIKEEKIAEKTVDLSKLVVKLRKEFELNGGTISHISGRINPADLGFHK